MHSHVDSDEYVRPYSRSGTGIVTRHVCLAKPPKRLRGARRASARPGHPRVETDADGASAIGRVATRRQAQNGTNNSLRSSCHVSPSYSKFLYLGLECRDVGIRIFLAYEYTRARAGRAGRGNCATSQSNDCHQSALFSLCRSGDTCDRRILIEA